MTTFVRVANTGNLSRAGRSFAVTPAAISRQLTALEAELGATLLVRTTRRIVLTDEGRRFLEQAERTIEEADRARASVRRDASVGGLVTVSVPTALGLSGMGAAIVPLLAEHPGLRIDLRLEDHPVDLLADGIDIALRAGLSPPDSTTLIAQPLAADERVVVAAPSYLRAHGEPSDPAQLAAHAALVQLHAGVDVGVWRLVHGTRTQTVNVVARLRANALHVLRAAALAGAGIALVPRFLVADDLRARRLRVLALGGWHPSPQQIYALVRVESKDRARVRTFLDHARRHLQELTGAPPAIRAPRPG